MASRKTKKPVESESEDEGGNMRSDDDSDSGDEDILKLARETKAEKKTTGKKAGGRSKKQEDSDEESDEEEDLESEPEVIEEPKPKGKKVEEKEISLFAYQVKHVDKLADILGNPLPPVPGNEDETGEDVMMGVIDRSPPGTGKTVTTLKIKQIFAMDIVIFAPTDEVMANWNRESRRWNIPFRGVYTYSSLVGTAPRGKKSGKYTPKSGLLYRNLGVKARGLGKTKKQLEGEVEEEFGAHSKLLKLIRGETLFVFDEAHKATGKTSLTSRAVMKIIELISSDPESRSRYMLLSGSLFEKYENLIALLRVMGIMKSYFMVNPRTGEPAALGELIDFARRFDNKTVTQMVRAGGAKIYSSRGQAQKDFVFALYDKVIQPNISSAMPSQNITLKINHLEYLKRDEVVKVGGALNLMHKTIDYEGKDVLALRRTVIMSIQAGLAPAAARFADRMLTEHPHRKIVLFYQFNEARDILKKALKKYNPLIIAGQQITSLEERASALRKFNAPNDKHRVIIVSILVGALGIQLDDKVGGYHHRAIILPVWSLKNMMQAADRVGRADTVWGGSDDPDKRDPNAEDRPRAYFFYAANATGADPDNDTMIKLMKKAIEKGKMLGVAMKGEKGEIPLMPDSFDIDYQEPPKDVDLYPPLNTELGRILREEAQKKGQEAYADILEGRGVIADDEEDFAEESGEEEEEKPKGKKAAAKKAAASRSRSTKKDEESESEEEEKPKGKSKAKAKPKAAARSRSTKKDEEEDSESEEEEKPKAKSKAKPKAAARSRSTKKDESDTESDEDLKPKKIVKPAAAGQTKVESKPEKPETTKPTAKPNAPTVTGSSGAKK